jgi:transcriptional regulator with XRE-family HTH domain
MQDSMTKPFADRVKEIRQAAKLKQAAFAERLGVDQSTVSRWEGDKQEPDKEALVALSKFSGQDLVAEFMGGAERPGGPPPDIERDAGRSDRRADAGRGENGALTEAQRAALTKLFDELLESLGATRATREQLVDPTLRRLYAEAFAALSIERLFPEAGLADETEAQRQLRLFSQLLNRLKPEQ